jgi:hypothetical protein
MVRPYFSEPAERGQGGAAKAIRLPSRSLPRADPQAVLDADGQPETAVVARELVSWCEFIGRRFAELLSVECTLVRRLFAINVAHLPARNRPDATGR